MDTDSHLNKNLANMKSEKVKVDEPFVPPLADDATEVQNLLAEPKPDHVSVDGVLCFGKENSWKHLELEDFVYGFECGLQRNCGGLDRYSTHGQDELEFGVLDGLLDEVDEVDDIHAANDISGACEDFLLDVELAEKISGLECAPSGRSCLGNSSSESQSPGFNGSSNGALGLSESSTEAIRESEYKNGPRGKKSVKGKINDSSSDIWVRQALVGNDAYMTSHNLENLDDLDDVKPLGSDISYDENEKKAVKAGKMSNFLRQKRLRKPTKRFIEEFSASKSKQLIETEKKLATASKNKRLKIKFHEEHHGSALTILPKEESLSETITQETPDDDEKLSDLRSKCMTARQRTSASKGKLLKVGSWNECNHVIGFKSAPREESFTITSTQAATEIWPRTGRPKKIPTVSVFDSDNDHTASESEDVCAKRRSKKGGDRRKHQRMWTLSEVSKLIDGIDQYGTGRWTDIKKLFFSSSAYRTPIDLRDKWRNLLRASAIEKQKLKQSKKEVKQNLKQTIRPLPKSVIRRIQELASLHPYPRFTPGGRYIRRKKN